MKNLIFLSTFLLLAMLTACNSFDTSSTDRAAPPVVLSGVNIVDVTNGKIQPNQTVIIRGDQIAEIGSAERVTIPENATTVNAQDKYLIPGLWDMHTHVMSSIKDVMPFNNLFLANGITGIRGLGDSNRSIAVISSDGKWVVFTSERDGTPKLYIKPVEGDSPARLLIESNSMQDQVAFAPDGSWIVFVSTHQGNADIYRLAFRPEATLNIEEAQNLTKHPGGDFRPAISPDGTSIAFSSDRAHSVKSHSRFRFAMQRTGDIYTMDASGQTLKRLSESDKWDGSPEWSPDGSQLYFYSLRSGEARIYRMHNNGSGTEPITPEGRNAISPRLANDSLLVFTSWPDMEKSKRPFRLLTVNMKFGNIDSVYTAEIDMFNFSANKNGLMTFHGGTKPAEKAINKGGFAGELLVQGAPHTYDLPGKTLDGYGVRRTFAAPPDPNGPYLVFETFRAEGRMDKITTFGYAILLLPVLTLVFFFAGIFLSIKNRKIVKPWRYLLFSLISVLFMVLLLGSFLYFVIESYPLSDIRFYMLGFTLIFTFLVWFSWRAWKKRLENNDPSYRVSRLTTLVLCVNTLFSLYLALLGGYLIDLDSDFFQINYQTREIAPLFTHRADRSIPPHFNIVLDTKYKPDGSAVVFSTGSFRGDPLDPGDIWEYGINQDKLKKISASDANDGFADFTADGSAMIYRSGKNGNMDLYLRKDGMDTQLTDTPDKENFPAISRNGGAVAYISNSKGTATDERERTVDIFLITKKDDNTWSEPKQLTFYEGQEGHPHFSPDGQWIVYATEEYGISDEEPLVQSHIFAPQCTAKLWPCD